MSDHTESCSQSQDLCDALFAQLVRKIPHLQRSQSARWCALFEDGRKRFAYVTHRKRMNRIEVWCLGEFEQLEEHSDLPVKPRTPTTSGWRGFGGRIFVDDISQIDAAAELLCQVSYQIVSLD